MRISRNRGIKSRYGRLFYRIWRKRSVREAVMAAALLMLSFPVFSVSIKGHLLSRHSAYAAPVQEIMAHPVRGIMTAEEQRRYARNMQDQVQANPDSLLGLVKEDISLILPVPELVRTEGKIKTFLYRDNECVLDIYLEQNAEGEPDSVIYYETRVRDRARLFPEKKQAGGSEIKEFPAQPCLQSLVRG